MCTLIYENRWLLQTGKKETLWKIKGQNTVTEFDSSCCVFSPCALPVIWVYIKDKVIFKTKVIFIQSGGLKWCAGEKYFEADLKRKIRNGFLTYCFHECVNFAWQPSPTFAGRRTRAVSYQNILTLWLEVTHVRGCHGTEDDSIFRKSLFISGARKPQPGEGRAGGWPACFPETVDRPRGPRALLRAPPKPSTPFTSAAEPTIGSKPTWSLTYYAPWCPFWLFPKSQPG